MSTAPSLNVLSLPSPLLLAQELLRNRVRAALCRTSISTATSPHTSPLCQQFSHPAPHYIRTCLNLIGFTRTKKLYWTDVLVEQRSEVQRPLHYPSPGQNYCKQLKPPKVGMWWMNMTRLDKHPFPEAGKGLKWCTNNLAVIQLV